MEMRLLYPKFREKAVTLSFDDGTFYDVIMVDYLNKHNIKCTFNINSGLFGQANNLNLKEKIVFHNRISANQTQMLYKGHEIASHSVTHPLLINQTKEFLEKEILVDIKQLSELMGEEIVGFVVPGGPYDQNLIDFLKNKVLYARTVENTLNYNVPEEFVPLHPSVFILNDNFEEFCSDYVTKTFDDINWLYIWGHSYEFALDDVWESFKRVMRRLKRSKSIYFGTNRDIIEYITAGRNLEIDGRTIINKSLREIFVLVDGEKIRIKPNSSVKVK